MYTKFNFCVLKFMHKKCKNILKDIEFSFF